MAASEVFSHMDRTLCAADLDGQVYAAQQLLALLSDNYRGTTAKGKTTAGKFARSCSSSSGGNADRFRTVLPGSEQDLEVSTVILCYVCYESDILLQTCKKTRILCSCHFGPMQKKAVLYVPRNRYVRSRNTQPAEDDSADDGPATGSLINSVAQFAAPPPMQPPAATTVVAATAAAVNLAAWSNPGPLPAPPQQPMHAVQQDLRLPVSASLNPGVSVAQFLSPLTSEGLHAGQLPCQASTSGSDRAQCATMRPCDQSQHVETAGPAERLASIRAQVASANTMESFSHLCSKLQGELMTHVFGVHDPPSKKQLKTVIKTCDTDDSHKGKNFRLSGKKDGLKYCNGHWVAFTDFYQAVAQSGGYSKVSAVAVVCIRMCAWENKSTVLQALE
jgi:hypothetical protein